MPIEMQATIAGVLLTALLTVMVYFYRSTITYEILSITTKLKIAGNTVVSSSERDGFNLITERITFKNVGFLDVDAVQLHIDNTPKPISIKVSESDSLSKSSIQFTNVNDQLEVSLATFPRGEQIVIEFAYIGYIGSEYRDVKGAGGKYKIQRKSDREAFLKGARFGISSFALVSFVVFISRTFFKNV